MKDRKKILLKIIGVIFIGLLIPFILSPYSTKFIGKILSFTPLSQSVSLDYSTHENEGHDEEVMSYFENEFEIQPYTRPFDSSIELIQLSLTFICLSLIINILRR